MANSPPSMPAGDGGRVSHAQFPSMVLSPASKPLHPFCAVVDASGLPLLDENGSPVRLSMDGSLVKIWNFAELHSALNAIEDDNDLALAFYPKLAVATTDQRRRLSPPPLSEMPHTPVTSFVNVEADCGTINACPELDRISQPSVDSPDTSTDKTLDTRSNRLPTHTSDPKPE